MIHRICPPLSALLCLLAGCAAPPEPPPPLAPPTLDLGVYHVPGSVLTGRRPAPDLAGSVDPARARRVVCTVSYLRRLPASGLQPLTARTRLVVAGHGTAPLIPVAEFAIGARVGVGAEAQQFVVHQTSEPLDAQRLEELDGVLFPGTTVAFKAVSSDAVPTEVGTARQRVVLLVSQEPGEAEPTVAMQFDDLVHGGTRVLRRHIVLLQDAPSVDGDSLVLVFPSPFGDGGAFLGELAVSASSRGMEDAVARARADLQAASSNALGEASIMTSREGAQRTLATSLRAMELSTHQRSSLVFLAQSTGAELALDLALAADDATLAAWIQAVGPETVGKLTEDGADPETFAWKLERSAYALLATRLDQDALTPPLKAVMVRHAGEVGRFPGSLAGVLARVTDRKAFDALVLAENREFLNSSDPSSRVRAFDWLAERGAVPEGFDPLADRKSRRAALAKAAAAAEAAAKKKQSGAEVSAAAKKEAGQ